MHRLPHLPGSLSLWRAPFGACGIMEKCDLCLTQDAGDIAPPCVDTCPGGALALRRVSSRQKRDHEAQIAGLLALARRPGRGA